ncbi:hypothetical protein [Ornithinimicrobium cerasi]|uniref:Uncharacterized protein n=1 Tax=Ornithinimicrobium cerasi TaxID=2248773 RepID=A0A285VQJ0_9MICO|nr:hypothetical protein [Ornithinimicrobium cerasi]SOC55496.1 hypothetical protein SAMN05421879_105113 [Ornithinimicrobium cerasi]
MLPVNARRLPPWAWILGIFVVLRLTSEVGVNLVPLLVLGFVAYLVVGNRRPQRRRPPVGPRPGQAATGPAVRPPAQDGPMPRIDVPQWPGAVPGGAAGREPVDPWAAPGGRPPRPGTGVAGTSAGMSSLGSDPVASLAQLQVAQAGRDLEQAVAARDEQQVEQALRRLAATVAQAHDSLTAAGSVAAGPVRASLDGLRGAAQEALRQGPGPRRRELVDRITSTCRAIGQTGRHE